MNEQLQEFAQFLYQVLIKTGKIQNAEEFQQAVQDLGEEKLNKIAQEYSKIKTATNPEQQLLGLQAVIEVIKSPDTNLNANTSVMQKQSLYARLGTKLNYINALRGKCPEGYEVASYGSGGVAASCKKCQNKENGGNAVEKFKKEKGGVKKHLDGKPVEIISSRKLPSIHRLWPASSNGTNYVIPNDEKVTTDSEVRIYGVPAQMTTTVERFGPDVTNDTTYIVPETNVPSLPSNVKQLMWWDGKNWRIRGGYNHIYDGSSTYYPGDIGPGYIKTKK